MQRAAAPARNERLAQQIARDLPFRGGHAVLLGAGNAGDKYAAGPLDGDARGQQRPERVGELAKLLPDQVERIADGGAETVPVSALREGDLVLVRPGASVPTDGAVEQGESQLDESIITGESCPVHKRTSDQMIAGTVNGSGSLRVRITKISEQTALAGIMRLVAEAQTSRSRAQALADRFHA
jgi:cation transport ATPase